MQVSRLSRKTRANTPMRRAAVTKASSEDELWSRNGSQTRQLFIGAGFAVIHIESGITAISPLRERIAAISSRRGGWTSRSWLYRRTSWPLKHEEEAHVLESSPTRRTGLVKSTLHITAIIRGCPIAKDVSKWEPITPRDGLRYQLFSSRSCDLRLTYQAVSKLRYGRYDCRGK